MVFWSRKGLNVEPPLGGGILTVEEENAKKLKITFAVGEFCVKLTFMAQAERF